ncbi:FAD:protein FMN transferase [Oscillospiraceae bacterium LTW-04]|nr:FAD:protein FMN transferase [Oscillospiraceae bacterium MB24-C1]
MKRFLFILTIILMLLTRPERSPRYTVTFWGAFDSMITITANAESRQQFDALTETAIARFTELSHDYDRFLEPGTIVNLATLNRMAGQGEIHVSKALFDLLSFAQAGAAKTDSLVIPTFGSVTELWRKQIVYAQNGPGTPPGIKALQEAVKNTDVSLLKLNKKTQSAALLSSGALLDVGAVAKGYATELVGRELAANGLTRLAISSGGNIRVFSPPVGKTCWRIGVQNPDAAILGDDDTLGTLFINDMAVATSGDYQRFFWYQDQRYHHLIDPQTLFPARYYRSVTVACNNAGEADLFSTALFLADWSHSYDIAEREKIAALWVMPDGSVKTNARMDKLIKNK